MDAMNEAVREAREDPAAARRFLTMLTYGCRTPACFESRRRDLIALGCPNSIYLVGKIVIFGVDLPGSPALGGGLDVGQVAVQGRLGYPGLLGDLAEARTASLRPPRVGDRNTF
jgi:hypothetical protein